ncbi:hypothetical protein RRG08_054144 [Elysia crispata]|uniref:Uncharacterized protein n=1 Tax=Elysia crispata TaxID=231223 RepID=A0AAE1CUB1_9GAST|nr:hypothetical protein RRG08_054144 [Elysia crispata]
MRCLRLYVGQCMAATSKVSDCQLVCYLSARMLLSLPQGKVWQLARATSRFTMCDTCFHTGLFVTSSIPHDSFKKARPCLTPRPGLPVSGHHRSCLGWHNSSLLMPAGLVDLYRPQAESGIRPAQQQARNISFGPLSHSSPNLRVNSTDTSTIQSKSLSVTSGLVWFEIRGSRFRAMSGSGSERKKILSISNESALNNPYRLVPRTTLLKRKDNFIIVTITVIIIGSSTSSPTTATTTTTTRKLEASRPSDSQVQEHIPRREDNTGGLIRRGATHPQYAAPDQGIT